MRSARSWSYAVALVAAVCLLKADAVVAGERVVRKPAVAESGAVQVAALERRDGRSPIELSPPETGASGQGVAVPSGLVEPRAQLGFDAVGVPEASPVDVAFLVPAPTLNDLWGRLEHSADGPFGRNPLPEEARDVELANPAPSREVVRRLIQTVPERLGALSLGRPDAGVLLGAVRLPAGPLWRIRDVSEAWATQETVDFLRTSIEAVERLHPGSPAVVIGDLSRPQGGPIGRHRSHQCGRDADIGWYVTSGSSLVIRRGVVQNLDVARSWALIRAFITETDVERIFVDSAIQRVLYRHAISVGEDRAWLDGVFGTSGWRRGKLIQHVRGHRSHLHVRFFNRRAQTWGRQVCGLIAEDGLLPRARAVVRAKGRRSRMRVALVQRADVPGTLVQSANGLHRALLRRGRRYGVFWKAIANGAPVVVPPRQRPPSTMAAVATEVVSPVAEAATPSAAEAELVDVGEAEQLEEPED
jgi:murein endopeptidase